MAEGGGEGVSFKWSVCDNCGAEEKPGAAVKLKRCSRCKRAQYCSRDCQKKHWKQHKPQCVNVDNVVPTPFNPPLGKMSKFSAGVVWLHGLGDSGAGWSFLQHEIGASLATAVGGPLKWVFPTAPTAPVTCNGGFSMTSWMDLDAIPVTPDCTDAVDDIKASVGVVHSHIDAMVEEGIPPNKIVVGGFSQGGCMSLVSTLTYTKTLAGGICLSGWAAMQDQYSELIQPANKGTPLLWGHGGADPTVITACQAAGVKALTEAGLTVQTETYAGLGHGSSPEEIDDVKDFIAKVLA